MTARVQFRGDDPDSLLARLPPDIGAMLATSIGAAPARLALVDEAGAWTYAELGAAIRAAAAALAQQGVRRGTRVVVIGGNSRTTAAILLAAWFAGAVAVPLNPTLAAPELDGICANAAPCVRVFCLNGTPQVRAHAACHGARIDNWPGLGPIGCVGMPDGPPGGATEADMAVLIYTSGTSGQPKGVMLTHENLLFMAAASGAIRGLTDADRLYLVLPISHIVGLSVILLGGLMHQATVQLAQQFHPAVTFRAMAQDGVTVLLGTPALVRLLLEYARTHPAPRMPALRIVSVSGAPLDLATKRAGEALFGLALHHGYGLTECSPTIAQMRPGERHDDCSVGRLLPGVQARLVGSGGSTPAAGQPGELHVRGPNVMRGYYRAPAETASAMDADGWFNTGDLARFDGDTLHIVGRTKDMLIRFGYNVYPAEVEAVLAAHPAVQACAVLGCLAGAEETLVAFVQPRSGMSLSAADLVRFAAGQLAPYKRPSRFTLVTALPLTPTGKVCKATLAAQTPLLASIMYPKSLAGAGRP